MDPRNLPFQAVPTDEFDVHVKDHALRNGWQWYLLLQMSSYRATIPLFQSMQDLKKHENISTYKIHYI